MNIKYAAFAAATLLACNAQAATVTINSITGKWINPVGGVAVSVDNSNSPSSIRWGNGVSSGPQSGYDFTPTMPQPIITGLNTSFALGEFAHLNFPVTGGAITDVDLQVTFDLTLDDGAGDSEYYRRSVDNSLRPSRDDQQCQPLRRWRFEPVPGPRHHCELLRHGRHVHAEWR